MSYPLHDALRQASFKGVSFDYQEIGDDIGRATFAHKYPNKPGADQEDLGREPRTWRFKAVFNGALGLLQRDKLILKLEDPGAGVLVHPVWGPVQAIYQQGSLRHSYTGIDYAEMDLTFQEDSTQTNTFIMPTPSSAQLAALQALANAQAAAAGFAY